jgi:8-oxo-dGTP diphosphatase
MLGKTTMKVCLILEHNKQVLFLEQTAQNGGHFTLPGGKVDSEEFAMEALVRECREEIGIDIQEDNLLLVHALHTHKIKKSLLTLYFKATQWNGIIETTELKKFHNTIWLPLHDLPDTVSETHRMVLERYRQGLTFTAIKMSLAVELSSADLQVV